MRVRTRFAELQRLDEKEGRVPWHVVGKASYDYVRLSFVMLIHSYKYYYVAGIFVTVCHYHQLLLCH